MFKQKKILLKMLLAEHFIETNRNNEQIINKKKLFSFMKNIVSVELAEISPTILKSNQFKNVYLDYYRNIFQHALDLTNIKYHVSVIYFKIIIN